MAKPEILVVDDEQDIRELLCFHLGREGYKVLIAASGEKALQIARSRPPALVILDLMLPGIDGLDVCKLLKNQSQTENIPIIMLTAKTEDTDIITGLEIGADDYVTKPFSPKVLIARIRKALKAGSALRCSDQKQPIKIHGITIDPFRRNVCVENKKIKLTLTEFNILYALARRPGIVFTRYEIVDCIHDNDYIVSDRAIDVQIAYLRKKLGPAKKYIETVRGVGYRFEDID